MLFAIKVRPTYKSVNKAFQKNGLAIIPKPRYINVYFTNLVEAYKVAKTLGSMTENYAYKVIPFEKSSEIYDENNSIVATSDEYFKLKDAESENLSVL